MLLLLLLQALLAPRTTGEQYMGTAVFVVPHTAWLMNAV
jgi:hypothetical protein